MPNLIVKGTEEIDVLYVYKCAECDHRGETHFAGDGQKAKWHSAKSVATL